MSFAKPQKGLVPIGGNFYATPKTPQKPNYSEPFKDIIDVGLDGITVNPPIGIDIEYIFDGCNVGIQATGFLMWMILPSFQLLWHNPSLECNPPPYEPDPLDNKPYPFPQKPPNPEAKYLYVRFHSYSNIFSEEGNANEDFDGQFPDGFTFNQSSVKTNKLTRMEEIIEEVIIGKKLIQSPSTFIDIYATHVLEWEESSQANSTYPPNNLKTLPGKKPSSNNHSFSVRTYINASEPNIRKDEILSYNSSRSLGEDANGQPFGAEQHSQGEIDSRIAFSVGRLSYNELADIANINTVSVTIENTLSNADDPAYNIGAYRNRVGKPRLFLKQLPKGVAPPPPPPKKEKKMCCCPEELALLKLLLKRLGPVPASVPQYLSVKNSPTITIPSIAEYIAYTVKQLDALTGQFPIEIDIEDADLTEEGNQGKTLNLPNMAETLAEMMTTLLLLQSQSDANLNATIRALFESGQTKQIAQITHDIAEASATYLGYKGKFVEKEYPMMFTPGEEQLDKILKETKIKLRSWAYDDKDDLNDVLAPLMEFSAMWKAQNFRNLGTSSPALKLKDIFSTGLGLAKKLSDINPDEDDFDAFTEQVENGFIAQAGVTDPLNPYGKDFTRRPRVKEVGTQSPE
ncbi:hypothetical protein [Anabaena lutea]|uniref:Uncharacterized protein n=1 Tax=Anabaena lutea FACHB-196 TaxID=2692881 RepID=A0ABR8FMD1_9NOST|nr:hypothetical protein [Anabaena lutea]MBD2571347.1 hypothetical protein [Anabaena lutea FACHB-196]